MCWGLDFRVYWPAIPYAHSLNIHYSFLQKSRSQGRDIISSKTFTEDIKRVAFKIWKLLEGKKWVQKVLHILHRLFNTWRKLSLWSINRREANPDYEIIYEINYLVNQQIACNNSFPKCMDFRTNNIVHYYFDRYN